MPLINFDKIVYCIGFMKYINWCFPVEFLLVMPSTQCKELLLYILISHKFAWLVHLHWAGNIARKKSADMFQIIESCLRDSHFKFMQYHAITIFVLIIRRIMECKTKQGSYRWQLMNSIETKWLYFYANTISKNN